jgi:uncharacterized membrane protein
MKPGATKQVFTFLLAALFIFTGSMHFFNAAFFTAIVPDYLPYHEALVAISGLFEILGGLGILLPPFRRLAGYGLIALLIAVFPANINMAVKGVAANGLSLYAILLLARLPLQFLLIAWVCWCALSPRSKRAK